jgi:hypothetical protein
MRVCQENMFLNIGLLIVETQYHKYQHTPKYLEMLPPQRSEYSLQCVKTVGGCMGLRPRPHWGAYSASPYPLAGLRVAASRQETPLRAIRRGGSNISTTRASQSATDNRNPRRIWNTIDHTTACTIATSLIYSKLDYCNSLLQNLPSTQFKRLQLVLNAAAPAVTKTAKFQHISPIVLSLYWPKLLGMAERHFWTSERSRADMGQ